MTDHAPAPLPGGHARLPGVVEGAFWMLVACAFFAVMLVVTRHVTASIHPFQGAFFRNAFGLLFMLPWVALRGRAAFRTQRPWTHVLRALLGTGQMMAWFTALSLMSAAKLAALAFTVPLFTVLGAGLVLGERIGLRRWMTLAIGFTGALLIVRPGFVAVSTPALIALLGALFGAAVMLTVKSLARSDAPAAIVFYMGLFMTPLSLVPALFVWETPSHETLAWLVLIGFAGTAGQIALARALRAADASAVMPFDYSKMVFTAALGYLAFGEIPDVWVWIGATVIFIAVLGSTRAEVRAARSVAPPAAATVRTE